MGLSRRLSAWLIAGFFLVSLARAQDVSPLNGYKVYQELKKVELDPTRVAEVQELTLQKDAATFRLRQGRLYLTKPVQGKATGAVFVGEGTFELIPPTEIEKYQLKKFTDNPVLHSKFSELCLRFSDQTLTELESKLTFVSGQMDGKANGILEDGTQRALKKMGFNLNARILEDLLFEGDKKGLYSGFLYADLKLEGEERMFFSFDPKQVEEVRLWRENPVMAATAIECDLVCSFHQAGDYKLDLRGEQDQGNDEIVIKHYRMEVKLEATGKMAATSEVVLVPDFEGIRVITFELNPELKVSGVKLLGGAEPESLAFVREDDQYQLTVILPSRLKNGVDERIRFEYAGEVLGRDRYGDYYIQSTVFWFPRYGYFPRTTFDITYRTPIGHKFVSAGVKQNEWKEKDYLCTQWLENFPTDIISFNLGIFEIYRRSEKGVPEVAVYWNKQMHEEYTRLAQEQSTQVVTLGKDMEKRIAADVINSLNFYQTLFCPYPLDQMVVTEIPYFHGQAFSGLLHLSWLTFQRGEEFDWESFRAHEVAHQWWGHLVGWKTYHDQWLSEGFAEYCGIWFAQLTLKDNQRFFGELKQWNDNIIKGNHERKSAGTKAGPLWLGQRLNTSQSEDYATLVYEKGAYILHMLRNMMMDLNTRSDDKFIEMLKDFATTYRGKNASSKDFQEIVEKHIGADMDWFFDQWVYGIEIPKYKYSYQVEKVENKYQVTLKVGQEKVSPGFKMLVPVVVSYSPEGYSVFRVWVDKPSQTIKLPLVPRQVNEVVFNPYFSVLCEAEEDKR